MKKNFYIHIGPHKTGSTTIQHYLTVNTEKLYEGGIMYPRSGFVFQGQHQIVKDLLNTNANQPVFGGLKSLVAELQPYDKDVILSSENFDMVMSEVPLQRLKDAFSEHYNFKVIMMYRDQIPQLISFWSSEVRLVLTKQTLREYIEEKLNASSFMNYKAFLSNYVEVFGKDNIEIIPFASGKGKNYLLEEFNKIVGIDALNIPLPEYQNTSPNFNYTELVRICPFHLTSTLTTDKIVEIAEQYLGDNILGSHQTVIPPKLKQKIRAYYKEDSDYLEKEFSHFLTGHLTRPDKEYIPLNQMLPKQLKDDFKALLNAKADDKLLVKNVKLKVLNQAIKYVYKQDEFEKGIEWVNANIEDNKLEYYLFTIYANKQLGNWDLVEQMEEKFYADDRHHALFYILMFKNQHRLLHDLNNIGIELLKRGKVKSAKRYFEKMIFNLVMQEISNAAVVIQNLISISSHRAYLEFGVGTGLNFHLIAAHTKVGVCPENALIEQNILDKKGKYYPLEYNDFFKNTDEEILKKSPKVICINNAYNYKDVIQLIEYNAPFLGPYCTIVVPGCYPKKTSQTTSKDLSILKVEKEKGEHLGDVYKAIIWVQSVRTDLHVYVIDAEYGVAIISKGTPENKLDVSDSDLSSMTYEQFAENAENFLNLKSKLHFDDWFHSRSNAYNGITE